jgi:hypothetical protein
MAIIIDDLDAAAAFLDPPVRRALAPVLSALRAELLALAAGHHGWPVVAYDGFAPWIASRCGAGAFVLDKLLPAGATPGGRVALTAHRVLAEGVPPIAGAAARSPAQRLELGVPPLTADAADGRPLVDDAAYTGTTLAAAARAVGARRAFAYVASRRAVSHLDAAGVALEARHLAPAGHDILHLRDLIPWLPWSGRRVAGRAELSCAAGVVEVRLAPLLHAGGAMFQLRPGDPLAAAVHAATGPALAALGGDPAVADLPRLGRGLAAPVTDPDQPVHYTTTLRSLLADDARR